MCWYDAHWRRRHGVEIMDELISLSFEKFSGERRAMNDGTWIEPGDELAILHFNRECFTAAGSSSRDSARSALQFRRLLIASLTRLAARMEEDKFKSVKALHGVSWLPPHGEKIGFMVQRLPDSLLNRIRKIYFGLLLKAFFPALAARTSHQIQPHAYWLTRKNLCNHFSGDSASD